MANKTLDDIMHKYTTGEASLEDTNKALKEIGSGIQLYPGRNELTEAEIKQTVIGTYPSQANGWGLLDTGTGSFDKVKVTNGKLAPENSMGESYALIIIAGRTYGVDHCDLVDYDEYKKTH